MSALGSRRLIEISARAARSAEPETVLEAAAALRREIAALEVEAVERALEQGSSWSAIAAALGISKQAAHKRYAKRTNRGHPPPLSGERRDDPKPGQARIFVTDGVRDAIRTAQLSAVILGHLEVSGAHVVLGLLLVDGAAADALDQIGIQFGPAWRAVRTLDLSSVGIDQQRLRDALRGQIPMSASAQRSVRQSLREANRLGHVFVGVEHLLLGLLREREETVLAMLRHIGVSRVDLERCLGRLLMDWKPRESETPPVSVQ